MTSLESQARYITRSAMARDAFHKLEDGNLALEAPADPRTGATAVTFDPLEWTHRITAHIRDPGRHCRRFCETSRKSEKAPDTSSFLSRCLVTRICVN
jgi:hypothetical protein